MESEISISKPSGEIGRTCTHSDFCAPLGSAEGASQSKRRSNLAPTVLVSTDTIKNIGLDIAKPRTVVVPSSTKNMVIQSAYGRYGNHSSLPMVLSRGPFDNVALLLTHSFFVSTSSPTSAVRSSSRVRWPRLIHYGLNGQGRR